MWVHASLHPFTAVRPSGDVASITDLNKFSHVQHSYYSREKMSPSCLGGSLPFSPKTAKKRKKKKAQSSRRGEAGREQWSREKAALLTVPKIPTIHRQGISSPREPELGNNCRPNQRDLQTHSHAHSRWGCLPGTPHSLLFIPCIGIVLLHKD